MIFFELFGKNDQTLDKNIAYVNIFADHSIQKVFERAPESQTKVSKPEPLAASA